MRKDGGLEEGSGRRGDWGDGYLVQTVLELGEAVCHSDGGYRVMR